MKIAIDAMGGDHAPEQIVKGALAAARNWPDTQLVLLGDQPSIEAHLGGGSLPNLSVQHTSEVIESDEEPVKAVRRKKDASMVVAGRMLRERQVDAMLSAGNTGALMTTGLLVVGRMDGIERPALAPMLPTMDNMGVLALDLGANMDAKPEHLLQYAVMGSIYREKVHGVERPRVGLLNVGTEPGKGNELSKAAYALLEGAPIHFVGNVESRDVMSRNCDVLICDGFAGNILLKTMEGTAGAIMKELKGAFTKSLLTKLAAAVVMPGIKGLRSKMDYVQYGGAPLLGLNGLVVKCHGSSDGERGHECSPPSPHRAAVSAD